MLSAIAENLAAIQERIRSACLRVGRDPAGVRLVAVSKTVPAERIREAVAAGVTILGENYVQEARPKMDQLQDLAVSWHFIGHLQSNKARVAVESFDWIHALDRESLAQALNREALKRGKPLSVLIQVNVGEEQSKSGLAPEQAPAFFRAVASLEGLRVRGLMAIPPYSQEPERVRPYFRQLAGILAQFHQVAPHPEALTELSMGMSDDFEVAIEEGATLVRIGTALFGERQAAK
jgi:pyridoxal phosphate enzyme (YggS family)